MDNVDICKICGGKITGDSHFWREHRMKAVAYYQKFFPRYDLYDKSLIHFKNKDFYLTSDFNSKFNLRMWLETVSTEEAKQYFLDYLKKRKERKNLTYAPTQVELRSLPVPGMKYLNDLFGNYYQVCESLGYKIKHTKFAFEKPLKNISKYKIIIDTREQLPLKFRLKVKHEALAFGDYCLSDTSITCFCFIERKSLSDFYGTLSTGITRFKKELEKASSAGANLIVLIESPFDSVYVFPKMRQVYGKIGTSPEFIFHNMRDLIQTFPNVQFLFVNDRIEASRVIEKIFASNCEYKNVDLQYLYDLKKL